MLQQSDKEIIVAYFEKHLLLTEQEKELLQDVFTTQFFKKKTHILKEGSYCQYIYFVVSGCLRMYLIDDEARTHILQFAPENWWIYDIKSFHKKCPSKLNIDALEDTQVLQLNLENFEKLCSKESRLSSIFIKLQENSIAALQERLLQAYSASAQERYVRFTENYPHLLNRLPLSQIASFIGVTPEFFSRMRSQMYRK